MQGCALGVLGALGISGPPKLLPSAPPQLLPSPPIQSWLAPPKAATCTPQGWRPPPHSCHCPPCAAPPTAPPGAEQGYLCCWLPRFAHPPVATADDDDDAHALHATAGAAVLGVQAAVPIECLWVFIVIQQSTGDLTKA